MGRGQIVVTEPNPILLQENFEAETAEGPDDSIINGDFAADSDWTKGAGWTIAAGVASSNGSSTNLSQAPSPAIIPGQKYFFSMDILDAGTIEVFLGSDLALASFTGIATHTAILVAGSVGNDLDLLSSLTGDIDNVILRPYVGVGAERVVNGEFDADSDWTKGTGWSIGSGVATKAPSSVSNLEQTVTDVPAERTYRVEYTVARRDAGTVAIDLRGTSGQIRSSAATFVENLAVTAPINELVSLAPDSSFDGDIDNVSVRPVVTRGRGWDHAWSPGLSGPNAGVTIFDTDAAVPSGAASAGWGDRCLNIVVLDSPQTANANLAQDLNDVQWVEFEFDVLVDTEGLSDTQAVTIQRVESSGGVEMSTLIRQTSGQLEIRLASGGYGSHTANINLDQVYRVRGEWNTLGNETRWWLDGVEVFSAAISGEEAATSFGIGAFAVTNRTLTYYLDKIKVTQRM